MQSIWCPSRCGSTLHDSLLNSLFQMEEALRAAFWPLSNPASKTGYDSVLIRKRGIGRLVTHHVQEDAVAGSRSWTGWLGPPCLMCTWRQWKQGFAVPKFMRAELLAALTATAPNVSTEKRERLSCDRGVGSHWHTGADRGGPQNGLRGGSAPLHFVLRDWKGHGGIRTRPCAGWGGAFATLSS